MIMLDLDAINADPLGLKAAVVCNDNDTWLTGRDLGGSWAAGR